MFTLWADLLSIPLSPCLWLIFYLSTSTYSKDIELGVKLVRDMVLPFVACDHGLSLFPLGGGNLFHPVYSLKENHLQMNLIPLYGSQTEVTLSFY